MLQYLNMYCSVPRLAQKINKQSKIKDWLLSYISINPVLWIWPQVFIHIAIDVFIWQTSLKESPGMANPGLTLICCDVIACLIHGLEKSNLFMRVPIVHLHVKNNSSIGLRKGEYGVKYKAINWQSNYSTRPAYLQVLLVFKSENMLV